MEHGKVGVRGRPAPHLVGMESAPAHETVSSLSIMVCLVTALAQRIKCALTSNAVRRYVNQTF